MTGQVLTKVSNQWRSRPDDERYTSLIDMYNHFTDLRGINRSVKVNAKKIRVQEEKGELVLQSPKGFLYEPSNWAFSQLCSKVGAPAQYLTNLPGELAADCLNYGLQRLPDDDEEANLGLLLQRDKDKGQQLLRAVTGPEYGRIWNDELLRAIIERVGDGVSGDWRVPGEFGKAVKVTKANTTLFAGDRDMFIFLADEVNRITVPNRRDGKSGTLARGFWISNSEVGSKKLVLGAFAFDYVCCNRMIWGVEGFKEISIKHYKGAPDRWIQELQPALNAYAASSAKPFEVVLREAQKNKVDNVDAFLLRHFGRKGQDIKATFESEEGRPIESRFDVVTAATAYAKTIPFQDVRVAFETKAGEVMGLPN